MISSTAGGPSLSQPWGTALKREFKVCFSGEGKMFHKNIQASDTPYAMPPLADLERAMTAI